MALKQREPSSVILTYRYRLLPSKAQHRALNSILESQRELYNAALEERIAAYQKLGISLSYADQARELTEWRRSDLEARSLALNAQRGTLKRLDTAFKSFYKRRQAGKKVGLPRFRGKGWFRSFAFAEFDGITLIGRRIRFKGMPGSMRVHLHRPLPDDAAIRGCVFRRDIKGWSVGFWIHVSVCSPRQGTRAVGVDLGIRKFAALSDGGFIPSLRAARRAERRLRLAQRRLSRRKSGSRRRAEARKALARCHAQVARQRANHLHQASARLIRDYEFIVVESLNLTALAAGTLAKDVRDASWGRFLSMLRYKAERAGVRLVEVNPRNTSQECSRCGNTVEKPRCEEWHRCERCGLMIDRDLNAARNILFRAGVGPRLHNVAEGGKRAGTNLDQDLGAQYVA
jgi:putative transposase